MRDEAGEEAVGRWMTAGGAARRTCRHCLKGVRPGERYRKSGGNGRGRALWEHAACGGELRDADPSGGACPGPGAGRYPNLPDGAVFEAEIKRECYHVADREGEPLLATGAGGNFPGLVVEWEWLSPAWPPYRLELGALAYARQRFEALANPLALAAIGAAAGRLQGTLVSPETLVATLADLAGEFEIEPAVLHFYLTALGLMLLCREKVDPDQVRRVFAVTARPPEQKQEGRRR